MDAKRQPAYLLDRDLAMDEYEVRNAIYTNALIMQGVKALVMKHTSGDILFVGHSTSGEISMLAYEDPDLSARLKGRFLGWGSGGPARLELLRTVRGKDVVDRAGASPSGGKAPIYALERRDPPSYSRGYSGFLNPLYEPGMSHLQIAERWLAAEARRRPNFKQQLQNYEHGADIGREGVGGKRDRDAPQAHRQPLENLRSRTSPRICSSPTTRAWTDSAAWCGRPRISTATTGIRNSR